MRFDYVSPATLRFEISWLQKRMTWQNFQQNKYRDIRSFPAEEATRYSIIFCRISNVIILEEILQSYTFLMSQDFETHGCI